MGTTAALARDLWRLAEQAERNGIRILVEPISCEHYATSASDSGRLYRLTHWSCTCKGFMAWQRCQHYALPLAQLGYLPDPESDPDPSAPAAAAAPTVVCPACRGRGAELVEATSGDWYRVPCWRCEGRGEVAPGEEPGDLTGDADRDEPPGDGGRPSLAIMPPARPAAEEARGEDRAPGQDAPPPPLALVPQAERAQALAATVDAAVAHLAEQLGRGHTAEFLAVLAFYARFRRYSLANTLLIQAQEPRASLVAGLRHWNRMGYRVRAGSKAIWIWAPILRKETDAATGEEVEVAVGFRPAPVFADTQLEGLAERPLPTPFAPLPDDAEGLYRAIKGRVEAAGIAVEERPLPAGVQGASLGGRVVLRPGLDSRSRLLTLVHEVCHEVAHQAEGEPEKPRQVRELEAESVAYVVGTVLGVPSPFSADYLLGYGLGAEDLKAALGTVQRLVREVLSVVGDPNREQAGSVRKAA